MEEETDQIELAILNYCAKNPEGVSQDVLQKALLGTCSLEGIVHGLNSLLSNHKLSIYQDEFTLLYRVVSDSDQQKLNGLGAEEFLVHGIIESSGNKGIWTRDIKKKGNLQQTQVTKILKSLESRKLVKAVRPVQAKNKKVYMLYDLDPHRDIGGGPWYNMNGDFDYELINTLLTQCLMFINSKKLAKIEEISNFIKRSGVCKTILRAEDVQTLVNTLIYDGAIEEVNDPRSSVLIGGKQAVLYKPSKLSIPQNPVTQTPCSVCPVFDQCGPDGDITPLNCIYLDTWIDKTLNPK